jgi:hypothetical protein
VNTNYKAVDRCSIEIEPETKGYRPYRPWYVLLSASEDDLTSNERARLVRIRSIPNTVRNLIMKRCEEIQKSIVLLESEHDALMDYINGEAVEK